MDWNVALYCLLIVLARIVDVSLGTVRTHLVVRGHRALSWITGFVEVTVWVLVVSKVVTSLDDPWVIAAYAFGFATGNVIGITIEKRIAIGDQVLRIFTANGVEVANAFRAAGFRVTTFQGEGMKGPVQMLFIQSKRKSVPAMIARARAVDPTCYYIVDDIQFASSTGGLSNPIQPTGWRAVLKKK